MSELIIVAAILWDFIFSEPPSYIHPTVWMGKFISGIWKIKPFNNKTGEFIWGFLIVICGVMIFGAIPYLLIRYISAWSSLLMILVSIPLLKVSFSLKYLFKSAREIRDQLNEGNLEEARRLTSYHLVSRNTDNLSPEQISSCVIESVSENITDSFTSPLFFFIIAGIPGSWAYRFINTSDAMIAYRNEEFEWGGKFTAWCDSLLNWIPARLTALMIVLSSFLYPGASGRKSWKYLVRDRHNTASPNAGWTMSAMAGALSVRLEKKSEYILGEGEDLPAVEKIDRSLGITLISLLLTLLLLVILFRGGIWLLNTVV
jgi:adenosylcobinamide-phosphate synthase